MERPEWVPLVRVLSLPYIIDLKNLPLLRRPISGRFIRWMDGWMAYLPLKIFRCLKIELFFFIFFKCLQLSGGTILIFFSVPTCKKYSSQVESGPKIRHFLLSWHPRFGQFGGRKSRFLDFFEVILELFRKCLGIVFDLERPSFGGIFSSKGR